MSVWERLRETRHEWGHVVWPTTPTVAYNSAVVAGVVAVLVSFVSVWELAGRKLVSALRGPGWSW